MSKMNAAARSAAASLTMSAKRARTAGDQHHQRPLQTIVNIEFIQEAYQASFQMPIATGGWLVSPEGVLALKRA
jgi:hypothetical protein